MKRIVISSENAPKSVGPYSQGILSKADYAYELSGQLGIDPVTSKLVSGGVEEETKQILSNIKAMLEEIGWNLENVTKTRIYLTDINDFSKVNSLYANEFDKNQPARVTIAIKALPLGAVVEIECTAIGNKFSKSAEEKYGLR